MPEFVTYCLYNLPKDFGVGTLGQGNLRGREVNNTFTEKEDVDPLCLPACTDVISILRTIYAMV